MSRVQARPYEEEREHCLRFLRETEPSSNSVEDMAPLTYLDQIQEIVNRQRSVLEVDMEELGKADPDLAAKVERNTSRYLKLFAEAADAVAKELTPTLQLAAPSVLDVYIEHRVALRAQRRAEDDAAPAGRYPDELLRRFQVVVKPHETMKRRSVREIGADDIGSLVKVEGIVIRATAVKPMMKVATYSCEACSSEMYQEVNSPQFMPVFKCTSEACKQNNRRSRLHLQVRASKFEKFQEIRIQEMANDVPTGHIPRSMTVLTHGEVTRSCAPGDQVTVTGIFLPIVYTGFRAIRSGLLTETYLEAMHVEKAKKTYAEQVLTEAIRERCMTYSADAEAYEKLANSIAPEIYGHLDVKKALLLLLVGGVNRHMADGLKIRGDINVLLMGDPGVAKSQLLKKVADLAPRGVYTTGRGSSGVGLTAAITRDPITNEFILEGGALVLADMGVCCIDEFDKMEDGDRTAIHEVMEQQTISIAKAGINTSLNARAAILAAANPLYGRYNIKKSPTQNINLPDALRSRFDLVFLLLDKPDEADDYRLAAHITYVHAHNDFPEAAVPFIERDFLRNYIAMAKTFQPFISKELNEPIAARYAKMRADAETDASQGHMTARTLLAMLRLASALARLRYSNEVTIEDFDEAVRLMDSSLAPVREALAQRNTREENPQVAIFKIVRDMMKRDPSKLEWRVEELRPRLVTAGYNDKDILDTLEEYTELNVLALSADKTTVMLVHQ